MEVTTSWMRQGIEIGRLEGITLGRREGRQEGITLGQQEGQRKEALGFLLRLLRRRFGFVSNALQERINALSVNQLEDLGEALLDFTEVREVTEWLNHRA